MFIILMLISMLLMTSNSMIMYTRFAMKVITNKRVFYMSIFLSIYLLMLISMMIFSSTDMRIAGTVTLWMTLMPVIQYSLLNSRKVKSFNFWITPVLVTIGSAIATYFLIFQPSLFVSSMTTLTSTAGITTLISTAIVFDGIIPIVLFVINVIRFIILVSHNKFFDFSTIKLDDGNSKTKSDSHHDKFWNDYEKKIGRK